MVIKVVTLVDMSVREFHGSEGTVRSLCFDPQMELLVRAKCPPLSLSFSRNGFAFA